MLAESFSQDPLEIYFGRQGFVGGRKDNPAICDFGYKDNSIRNQKVFRPIAGNVKGLMKQTLSLPTNQFMPKKRKN